MRLSTRRRLSIVFAAVVASALAACGGAGVGGGGATQNLMPQNGYTGTTGVGARKIGPINIYPGEVVGEPNKFNPHTGDSPSGGQGQKVGAITCDKVEHIANYHVHYYVGLLVNGKQIAIPMAIGIMHPEPARNGYISKTQPTGCWYWIHTHDASGMMHIEDPRSLPPSDVLFKFGAALSVWGVTASANNFAQFKGPVHVYVGNVAQLGQTTVNAYTPFTKGVAEVPLHSHTVIWIEVGAKYLKANQLPPVTFYTEY
ncbi:MAG TPA: hypothetical protein VMF61_00785 [Candidatus Acidoferrales bacterium]|nr:hypothetical protein [Candidatus Acidoferrales bacterium]